MVALLDALRIAFGAAIILLALYAVAFSHEWYDPECCSGQDCFQVDEHSHHAVSGEAAPGGYLIRWRDLKWVYSEKDVRRSQDGKYHICLLPYYINHYDELSAAERGLIHPICVYVPSAGM